MFVVSDDCRRSLDSLPIHLRWSRNGIRTTESRGLTTICPSQRSACLGLPGLRYSLSGQPVFVGPDCRKWRPFPQAGLCTSGDRHLSSLRFPKTAFAGSRSIKLTDFVLEENWCRAALIARFATQQRTHRPYVLRAVG